MDKKQILLESVIAGNNSFDIELDSKITEDVFVAMDKYAKYALTKAENLPISDVSGQSELLPLAFIKWYSGMDQRKILKAHERWKKESGNSH